MPSMKRRRVKCPTCKAEYDEGAPHVQFCAGCPPYSECEECGQKHEESFKCSKCDAISCPECGLSGDRLCSTCLAEQEATGEST
jgi:hypothetical protein